MALVIEKRFHGATDAAIEQICREGFDPRRGGESTGAVFYSVSALTGKLFRCKTFRCSPIADPVSNNLSKRIVL